MGKQKPARANGRSADTLVRRGAKAEKRLLRLERKAEHVLSKSRTKLQKAQVRLERRLAAVSDAEALLRARQAARAAGPDGSNGSSLESLKPPTNSASDSGAELTSPVIVLAGEAPSEVPAAEPAASLTLPSAAKPPTRRRSSRSGAAKTPAS